MRVSDRELFERLKPVCDKLKRVRDVAKDRDFREARCLFCDYIRGREIATWHETEQTARSRKSEYNREAADRAVSREFTSCHVDHSFEGPVDWFFNATHGRSDIAYTPEWMWQLNRMHFWVVMGKAYQATGDERYARAFAEQLESWVRSCPRPNDNGNYQGSAWRTIEAGIRMGQTWPEAFHLFLQSPSFTDDHLILYVKSCVEHAEHLLDSQDPPRENNWVMMEMNGLYSVGAVFPEFTQAKRWRTFALNILEKEQRKQFLPDGFQFELTTGYHNVSLINTYKTVKLAMATGRQEEIPDGMISLLEKAFDVNLYMMSPDGTLPALNDSGHPAAAPILKQALELFPERQDYVWAATRGLEGKKPAVTSVFFNYAGYAVMRSGWSRDATTLYFDNGPVGASHVHQDKLNLILYGGERELLFDAGGGMYDVSDFRKYDISTFAHNTVTVDGLPQRRTQEPPPVEPVDAEWQSSAGYDFASGIYTEDYGEEDYRPAAHHREVLFLKPGNIIVADRLEPRDNTQHEFQSRWHLRSTRVNHDEASGAVVSTDPGMPNVAVTPLSPNVNVTLSCGQKIPELSGWYVRKDQRHEPATTITHTWKSDVPSVALTLILPLKTGEKLPVKRIERPAECDTTVIFANGSRIHIKLSDSRGLLWRVTEDDCEGKMKRQFNLI
ncbi:MAG: alginate lyase family protein [Verrucomicrobiota bacterium]